MACQCVRQPTPCSVPCYGRCAPNHVTRRSATLNTSHDDLRHTAVNGPSAAWAARRSWLTSEALPVLSGGKQVADSEVDLWFRTHNFNVAKSFGVFTHAPGVDALHATSTAHKCKKTELLPWEAGFVKRGNN